MKSEKSAPLLPLIGLSIATSPFIITILTLYLLADLMAEWGKVSEEIFRSERLPVLNFSHLTEQ